MNTENKSTRVLLRILIYSAFGAALWLKLKASHVHQLWVVSALFTLAVIVLDCFAVRLLWGRVQLPPTAGSVLVARSTTVWVLALGIVGISICNVEVVRGGIQISTGVILSGDIFGAAWLSGFIGMLFSYAGGYELRITPYAISYLSLFGGLRVLKRDEIDNARICRGWVTPWDRFKPTNRLEIVPHIDVQTRPIFVNTKAFKPEDVKRAFDWLGEKVHSK